MKLGKHSFSASFWSLWWLIYLTTNKRLEIQFEGPNTYLAKTGVPLWCELYWTTKQSHCGPGFSIKIKYLFFLEVHIYDDRHWDHDNDKWYTNESWNAHIKSLENE